MQIQIKIIRNGQPIDGVTAMIVEGPAGWEEIASVSNEDGLVALPIEEKGTYTVRLFTPLGQKDVKATEKKLHLIEL